MANEAHIKILKKGVEAWNKWRDNNPEVEPDLSDAILTDTYLENANLNRAKLVGADLSFSSLFNANLVKADLVGSNLNFTSLFIANLYDANLSSASLFCTNCSNTNLSRADLSSTILVSTNLCYADLRNANFEQAQLAHTVFGAVDLTGAVGLEMCEHRGPSIIDYRTILQSGILPLKFLQGCGLSDIQISYIPSLIDNPLQFYSCFISYSSNDNAFAERLHADLQNKGVRCWFAPEDLKIGDVIRPTIDESIKVHDKLLIVLSQHSVSSQWVEKEVETALEKEREQNRTVLFPVRVDDAIIDIKKGWPADIRRTRHIGDFQNWQNQDNYQRAFSRLLRDLKASG